MQQKINSSNLKQKFLIFLLVMLLYHDMLEHCGMLDWYCCWWQEVLKHPAVCSVGSKGQIEIGWGQKMMPIPITSLKFMLASINYRASKVKQLHMQKCNFICSLQIQMWTRGGECQDDD